MKIKVTEERDCCTYRDLKPVEGCARVGREPEWMFCVHCGHRHELSSRRDPAGGSETYYKRVYDTWEPNHD